MVEIICSESGIKFEAATRRTKQHPLIAAAKAKANKDSKYRELNEALAAVRKSGGYETIEQFMALVDDHMSAHLRQQDEIAARRREADKEAQAAHEQRKIERDAQNKVLRDHGYNWQKIAVGTEDDVLPDSYMAGVGEFSHSEWRLYAPNGRRVTVAQAMDEINGVSSVEQSPPVAEIVSTNDDAVANIQPDTIEIPSDYIATTVYDHSEIVYSSGRVVPSSQIDQLQTTGGITVFRLWTGTQPWIHAPKAVCERWWQARFDKKPVSAAWDVLHATIGEDLTYGKEYRQYLLNKYGVDKLVEIAKSETPPHVRRRMSHDYADPATSKHYQLPVLDVETGEIGYGKPGETIESVSSRIRASEWRDKVIAQTVWISLSD